ncbi:MAG: hypothetical protein VYC32_04645, partial [Planctomycetota bacterium]|nr:hypothetical protein [Planctomycetota bacterium]
PGANFIDLLQRLPEAWEEFGSGREEGLLELERLFSLEPVPERAAMKLQLGMIFLASGLLELEELL